MILNFYYFWLSKCFPAFAGKHFSSYHQPCRLFSGCFPVFRLFSMFSSMVPLFSISANTASLPCRHCQSSACLPCHLCSRRHFLPFSNSHHNHHPSYGRGCWMTCRFIFGSLVYTWSLKLPPQPSSVIRKRLLRRRVITMHEPNHFIHDIWAPKPLKTIGGFTVRVFGYVKTG